MVKKKIEVICTPCCMWRPLDNTLKGCHLSYQKTPFPNVCLKIFQFTAVIILYIIYGPPVYTFWSWIRVLGFKRAYNY